jgi:hypothetical protein
MTNFMLIIRRHPVGLALPLLLAAGLLVAGCESDSVAPQDDVPALSSADVAGQTGRVAMAASMVAPVAVNFAGKADKDLYVWTPPNPISGAVQLAFFTGGAPSAWSGADHVDISTDPESPLVIPVGIEGAEGTVLLGFDLGADIDRSADPDQAVINGTGTYQSGPYPATFAFEGLVVDGGGSYPGGGTMTFTSGGHTGTVTYDGTDTATLVMDDGSGFVIDLNDGTVTPVGGA